MAGGNESPRQKMIGMMYLVLTAILALNVSREILNSFIVVNNGLENTNQSFTKRTENLYASFDFQKGLDPARVTPYWSKAQEAKKITADLYDYIEQLKKRLVMETEGVEKSVADTLQLINTSSKDNYDITTHIMIGENEDGSKGVARKLKEKLNAYKSKMLSLVDKEVQATLQLPINTSDPTNDPEFNTWELQNFFHSPLAASVTILSKLQSDVKNSEAEVVSHLLSAVDSETLKFDTVTAKVIPQSNYVLVGEEYKADVFIAAYSKTQMPTILAGDYDMSKKQFNGKPDSLPVEKGQGKFSMVASREGFVKWGGTISIRSPKGKILTYPYETEFIAARPMLTVSADAMNVFYAGVPNPVSISVPGIPNEKLKASIDNGTLSPAGNGKFTVTGLKAGKANINVVATMDNGETRNMGKMEFRVKQLPKPVVTFAGVQGGKLAMSKVKTAQGLAVNGDPGFVFQVTYKVVSFTMEAGTRGSIELGGKSNSGYLSEKMQGIIKSLRKGDSIIFTEIKAADPGGTVHSIPDIAITIM
jgi:gliding motility-associated protein GldM